MAKRVHCDNCESDGHPTFMCPKPAKKSTAARMDVQRQKAQRAQPEMGTPDCTELASRTQASVRESAAGTQALLVDTNDAGSPNGRVTGFEPVSAGSTPAPASKFNKTDYQREYVAKWRRGEVGNKHRSKAKEDKQNG